jgi:hypothetical protein
MESYLYHIVIQTHDKRNSPFQWNFIIKFFFLIDVRIVKHPKVELNIC